MGRMQIRLTESQLRKLIQQEINEALNEGLWGGLKNAFGKVGDDVNQGVSNMGNSAKNFGSNAMQGVRNMGNKMAAAGRNAMQGIKNYANDVKTSYQKGSLNADNQKIANQLQQWYQDGAFAGSRQASSAVQILINALNKNFNSQFGEMGNAQRYQ